MISADNPAKRINLKQPPVQEKGLNELIYTLAYCLTDDQKSVLPYAYLDQIRTAKKARRFANKSSTDQKREFLSYLGLSSFFVIANLENQTASNLKEVLTEYKKGSQVGALKKLAEDGVFVSSDKEFVYLLGMLSQSITTPTYSMNLELMRVGYHLRRWPKKMKSELDEESEDLKISADVIAKLILFSEINFDFTEIISGVLKNEMKLLYFMYFKKGQYLSLEEMKNYFLGNMPGTKIAVSLRRLIDSQMMRKNTDWEHKEYTITKLGIRTVHEFRDRVLKSFNF